MKPFLLVNAGSGGGKMQESILQTAGDLGIGHHVVTPGELFGPVIDRALQAGADVLAAAGGDGTLSAVADVATTHDLPMVVVPAGTRNHFALDVGLDLTDPAHVLRESLTQGHERRIDLGSINGVAFLNNASIGAYASAVTDPQYRHHKVRTMLAQAHDVLDPKRGDHAQLSLDVPGVALAEMPETTPMILIANNAYSPGFAPGQRLRPRLDAGEVWVYTGGGLEPFQNLTEALHSVRGGLRSAFATRDALLTSDRADIPVAIDGEVRPDITAPFQVSSRAGALRLLTPADPGPRQVSVTLSW